MICADCPIALKHTKASTAYCPFLNREIINTRPCRFSLAYLAELHRNLTKLIDQLEGDQQ